MVKLINCTVCDLNIFMYSSDKSSEQVQEVQSGLWLLQQAFDLLQSSVTNSELHSHIENSIRNLLSINVVLRSLNIQVRERRLTGE